MTQTQLAEAMGVTPPTITGWETGKSFPHFQVLLQLHDFFNVNLERLIFEDFQKTDQGKVEEASFPYSNSGINSHVLELFEQLKGRIDLLESRLSKVEGA